MVPAWKILEFIAVVGIGSTVILDLWGFLVSKITGGPVMNWGLPGRWLVGLCRGQLVLQDGQSATTTAEQALGWGFHYGVGITYAAFLLLIGGAGYIAHPTLWPPLIVSMVVANCAGLFIMIPGLGAGICASKTLNPAGEIRALVIAHIVFGLAEYGLALCMA